MIVCGCVRADFHRLLLTFTNTWNLERLFFRFGFNFGFHFYYENSKFWCFSFFERNKGNFKWKRERCEKTNDDEEELLLFIFIYIRLHHFYLNKGNTIRNLLNWFSIPLFPFVTIHTPALATATHIHLICAIDPVWCVFPFFLVQEWIENWEVHLLNISYSCSL